MRAILIGIFCVGMGTEAFARDCASILDRAIVNVNEREVRSADINNWISDKCSGVHEGISTSISYADFGLDISGSKKSILLNKLCEAYQSNKRSTFVERVYSQNVQAGFFAAYNTCMDAESPLVFVLRNENKMRTAIVNVSSRDGRIEYSISIDGDGAPDVKCSPHGTNGNIQDIDFSKRRLDRKGFRFTCNHKPKTESADDTRVYRPAVVSIATTSYSPADKIITIPFSESTYVVGESLKKLKSEINDLKQKTDILSEKNMSIDRKIACNINLSRPIHVLSVDSTVVFRDGYYFNFNAAEVDEVLGREDWHDKVLSLVNNRNGLIGDVVMWRGSNGGSRGDAHGRWNPVISLNDWVRIRIRWSDSGRDWRTGDTFSFLIPNNREQCQ